MVDPTFSRHPRCLWRLVWYGTRRKKATNRAGCGKKHTHECIVCVFWHEAAGYQDQSQYIKHVAVPNPDVGQFFRP